VKNIFHLCTVQELSIFKHKDSILEYEELSNGSKKMLCFNGYCKVTTDLYVFKDFFAKDINAIAINLPYHGNSIWNIGTEGMKEIFLAFFKHLKWDEEEIHLFAYSIGSRYTYALTQLFPNKIKSVCLLAPDGIYPNTLSHYATFNSFGTKLMNLFINRAGFIIYILKSLKYFKVLSESDYAFFLRKIRTKEDREMLQKVWKEIYTTTPDFKNSLAKPMNKDIRWNIILGKSDKVFPYKKTMKLIPKSEKITVHVWDSGHAMLKESIGYKLSLQEGITP